MNITEISPRQVWIHKRKQRRYKVVSLAKARIADGEWTDSVVYRPEIVGPGDDELFVRDAATFLRNFERVRKA